MASVVFQSRCGIKRVANLLQEGEVLDSTCCGIHVILESEEIMFYLKNGMKSIHINKSEYACDI